MTSLSGGQVGPVWEWRQRRVISISQILPSEQEYLSPRTYSQRPTDEPPPSSPTPHSSHQAHSTPPWQSSPPSPTLLPSVPFPQTSRSSLSLFLLVDVRLGRRGWGRFWRPDGGRRFGERGRLGGWLGVGEGRGLRG